MLGKGAPRCPRCNDFAYYSESVQGASRTWHNHCFTCKNCNTRLSSTTLSDKDGEIYCNPCYGKLFGPKGFGIGGTTVVTGVSVADKDSCPHCGRKNQQGRFCGECGKSKDAAPSVSTSTSSYTASSTTTYTPPSNPKPVYKPTYQSTGTSSANGGTDKCGKCGKAVFYAERITGAGRVWHESCFTCEGCKTRLNSLELADKDGRLFCGACYSKNFGPKGYGFAGGGGNVLAYTK